MKILFISTPHVSGAIEAPALLIAEGFSEIGHESTHIVVSKEINRAKLLNLLDEKDYDLIFTMDIRSLLLRRKIRRICEIIDCPVAIFFLDHPAYHIDGISRVLPRLKNRVFLLSPEMSHVELTMRYAATKKLKSVKSYFFPWAAPSKAEGNQTKECKYDLLCFNSLDTEIHRQASVDVFLKNLPCPIQKSYFENFFYDLIYDDLLTPLEKHLENANGSRLDLGSTRLTALFAEFDSLTKKLRRAYFARKVIDSAEALNLRVCLCGTGWDGVVKSSSKNVIMGNVHYSEQFKLYRQSKILVNLDPNWTHGIHDRVFNALSSNCLVVTSANGYSQSLANSKKKLIYFDKISEIPQKISIAMGEPLSENGVDLSQNRWIDRALNFTMQMSQG